MVVRRWLVGAGRVRVTPATLASVFALGGTLAVVLLSLLMPPFENSDEFTHLDRVDQIALGDLIARRGPGGHDAGGRVDSGIGRVDAIIGVVRWHPDRTVTRAALAEAGRIRWGDRRWTSFDNTAVYAPVLYLPAVVAVLVGKFAHLPVVATLLLARLATGLLSVGVAAIAIGGADMAAPVLFAVLSLPMSLSLFASVSQDGPMLAAAAAAVAALGRIGRDPAPERAPLVVLALSLGLIGLGRPAYLPIALVLVFLRGYPARARLWAFGAVIAVVGGWSALASRLSFVTYLPQVVPGAQARALLADPGRVVRIAIATWNGRQGMENLAYWREIIGVLGWIDAPLPRLFYVLLLAALFGAALLALPERRWPLAPLDSLVLASGLVGATLLVFALEYLTWTAVGAPAVDGVQGRYFLPLLMFVPLLLPPLGRWWPPLMAALGRALLLGTPLVAIVAAVLAIVDRYDIPPG